MGYLALSTLDQQRLSQLKSEINRRLLELTGVIDIAILADHVWNLIGNAQVTRDEVARNLQQFMPAEKVFLSQFRSNRSLYGFIPDWIHY